MFYPDNVFQWEMDQLMEQGMPLAEAYRTVAEQERQAEQEYIQWSMERDHAMWLEEHPEANI